MKQREKIIERYFELSDRASTDQEALDEIVRLFANDAVVQAASGVSVNTPAKIANLFERFFKDNTELHHVYQIAPRSDDYQTEWVVAGEKRNGSLFVLHGFDHYQFNENGQITFLKIKIGGT